MNRTRTFCPHCTTPIEIRTIDNRPREYCPQCDEVFYDNPLPVVSAIVVNDQREVLLVLRDRKPNEGEWCLPSGFVEVNESIEDAALRELREETGLQGKIVRLQAVQSYYSSFYGDLIWVTFEVERKSGDLAPGDDAREAKYFPISNMPALAFVPNQNALNEYIRHYQDIWSMHDSFTRMERGEGHLLSDSMVEIITRDAKQITENWVLEVIRHRTTRHYRRQSADEVYDKAHFVISQFGKWMSAFERKEDDIWSVFRQIGADRRVEGFPLSEVISALSLTRKHIFAHVLGQGGVWNELLEIYSSMEFISRVNLFFDKATYHITVGYESAREK